ncbi:MAG: aminopeptidase P family protein [Actinomycetia bacterium]|nr:aminopeptidase P family protein [Actinomycetes bacterium]
MRFQSRRAACVEAVERSGADALLVTNLTNVRYLTGLVSSAAMLVVGRSGEFVLLTDGRYREQAHNCSGTDIEVVVGDKDQQGAAIAKMSSSWSELGLEAGHVSWATQRKYDNTTASRCSLKPTLDVVEGLRLVKDDLEIATIERAGAIADRALLGVVPMLGEGPTEREFKIALDRAIIDCGADDLSFDTIVASGPNSARGHHSVSDRVIGPGDLIVLDCGALVDGYHSDMTRSFHVGAPSAEVEEILGLAQAAYDVGVGAVRPGVSGDDVDKAARSAVEEVGRGDEFIHGVGHGVGLDIHENPFMRGSGEPLVVGQVVTVEPGVYRSGVGGARVEDTVVVTEHGCRRLTTFSKDPIVG